MDSNEIEQVKVPRMSALDHARSRREKLFPGFPEEWLWRHTIRRDACILPRILPIAMQAIDLHSRNQPAGSTLFGLWAHSSNDAVMAIESPKSLAGDAGFHGERAASTWLRRMMILKELQFIFPKRGPSGDFHHVLLTNPSVAIELMRSRGQVSDILYKHFIERIKELGELGTLEAFRSVWFPDGPQGQT